eukprot:Seg1920.3 transcript_id=Seg1920.3/GoldUCD/mRNA.D3Y31 product="BTB/POZ domain-containing protein KCTD7" protein_id=Seg1920.3/GoldUCD/D3Y31
MTEKVLDPEGIEGVNPREQTNSESLADDYSTTNPTNVNGLPATTEGEANGLDRSHKIPEESIFDDVKQNINTVYVVLKEDLELLASKRDKFMLMSQKINDVHFSEVIKLNVGGHIFQTSLQNMRKYPESTLAAMFSENVDLVKGDDGAYFIDRDGTHFRHILNFLRSGDSPPENILETAKEELIREAEFFGLGRLAEIIKEPNTEIIEGGENQSKANESQSLDKNDLESKINEHCQQTQAIIDEIKLKIEKWHSALQRSYENLKEQKMEYLEMTKKVETVHFPKVVKLNVGGQIFQTNVKTLQKDPDSLLATMFSEQIEVIKQENETYFIDRSGTLFEHVLNYLRTGKIPQKIIQDFGEELLEEALFYNIKGMVESITNSIKRVKINVGGSIFETSIDNLRKYPRSKLAKMLNKEVDGIDHFEGTYNIKRSNKHFGDLLKVIENKDIPEEELALLMTRELINEAHFYGVACFDKYAVGGFFSSMILKFHAAHQRKLLEWLNITDEPNSIQLVYSAELDGWDAEDFHKNCDGISPTLVLMESTNGNIFGGYTTKPWSSNKADVRDKELFVFQLAVKQTEETFKTYWKNPGIMCMSSFGPMFGFIDSGDEFEDVLKINSTPNINWSTCKGLENFTTHDGLKVTNKRLAGSERFRLTRMEVFEVIER